MSGTVLAVIAQGAKRLALGDRVYEYRAGQYLVASVDLPVTGHFVDASPRAARRWVSGSPCARTPSPSCCCGAGPGRRRRRAAPPGIAVSDAPDELLDAVLRLVRLLDQPRDRDVLAPLVIREILWRLITGEQGDAGPPARPAPTAGCGTSRAPCAGSATTTRSPSGSRTWRGWPG